MKYIDAEEITPIMAEYVADVFSRKEHLDDISYGYCMEIADAFRRYAERAKQEQPSDDLEEPDKDLEDAANKFAVSYDQGTCDGIAQECFKAGAEWQEKRWENNRLMAQDHATEEECQREMDFVDNHIKKHHRIPTFSDAINYGIEWQKKQMPLPEDTLIFRKGVEEGRRLEREDMLKDAEEEPDFPGFEEDKDMVVGRDYVPVDWVETLDLYGRWKIIPMRDAVEGEVCILPGNVAYVKEKNNESLKQHLLDNFKAGDKVRIIIIAKEED